MKKYDDLGLTFIERDWPAIEQEIRKHVTDWSVCVQAGGHFGLYPTELSKMFAEVHTFEPYAENYVQLAENCKERDNITCYLKALGAYVGTVDILHLEGGNSGMNITIPGDGVPAVTIDSLKLSSCGLIQLDIEQYELFALMGAIETIEKFNPVIILESPAATNNACNEILWRLGYCLVGKAGQDSVFKYLGEMAAFKQQIAALRDKRRGL